MLNSCFSSNNNNSRGIRGRPTTNQLPRVTTFTWSNRITLMWCLNTGSLRLAPLLPLRIALPSQPQQAPQQIHLQQIHLQQVKWIVQVAIYQQRDRSNRTASVTIACCVHQWLSLMSDDVFHLGLTTDTVHSSLYLSLLYISLIFCPLHAYCDWYCSYVYNKLSLSMS